MRLVTAEPASRTPWTKDNLMKKYISFIDYSGGTKIVLHTVYGRNKIPRTLTSADLTLNKAIS